jgi:hypothetical protein
MSVPSQSSSPTASPSNTAKMGCFSLIKGPSSRASNSGNHSLASGSATSPLTTASFSLDGQRVTPSSAHFTQQQTEILEIIEPIIKDLKNAKSPFMANDREKCKSVEALVYSKFMLFKNVF